ncbi:MAG: FAD-dependent oxidoreductase, partial [Bacillota bacterium]
LSAAYQLAKKGYSVTVFEAAEKAGGMLRYGIPAYRLPKEWVDLEVALITRLGVEIKYNSTLGKDFTLDQLFARGYEAVFIAVGAHKEVKLGVPGEDLEGILYGVDFLRRVNKGEKVPLGEKVAVIGGGNTAMDAARTALRLGAQAVTIVYRRSEQEITAQPEEIAQAKEEGINFLMLTSPKAFHGEGKVSRIECLQNELGEPDASGRRRPVPVPGSEFFLAVDNVIVAIGQAPDTEQINLAKNRNGTFKVDPHTLATDKKGVFAGGDAVTGPASVVEAVGAGKKAAEAIDRYLRGREVKFEETKEEVAPPRFTPEEVETKTPLEPKHLPPEERKTNFAEACLGYTDEAAKAEADRCLNCGVCSECGECVRACLRQAIDHKMPDTELEIEVGAVILSPGFEVYNARNLDYYGYGVLPNVITSLELERILSASGPYQGHLVRPSDGKEPQKMAFIQCVGSRNVRVGRNYCSSACCMYTIKEAVIAKEHSPGPLTTKVFFMDMRTHGKDFERYYERAKNEYGVEFIRSRIYAVEPAGNGDLKIKYATEDGTLHQETFDLVVLAVGLNPPEGIRELAEAARIELDQYGFCASAEFDPGCTTRPGIYAGGVFRGPKDIPETVMEASAACGYAAQLLGDVRGTLTKAREFPAERDISDQEPRIGVFICNCGINIGGVVDVSRLVEYAKKLPHVVYADQFLFTCSQDSIERIKQAIAEHTINRVVVASCSPRTHKPLFQETIREAGLNRHLFEMANIRDQCSWVHMHEPEKATEKAIDLLKMTVAKAALLEPITQVSSRVTKIALVVGGGVAGMNSALTLAEQGYQVHLVEKEDSLGGLARRLRQGLKGGDVRGYLADLVARVNANPLIRVHTGNEIREVSGYVGNYVTILTSGLVIRHGVAVIATGAQEYRPAEYCYGRDDRVLTQLELEEAIAGDDPRVREAKNVVLIQCVGSREKKRPYCSRVCCSKSVKLALKIKGLNPKANVFVLYRDMRTYSFFEEYYQEAREKGVIFVRFEDDRKPVVEVENGRLTVKTADHILGVPLEINADLIGLAAAIVPSETNGKISQFFKIPLNQDGFFLEAHMKLRPVDFATEGIFMAGTAHGPKNLEECIAQAKAAAGRAATILSKDVLESHGITAQVRPEKCEACLTCVRLCPYGAPRVKNNRVEIEAVVCQGCGTCAGECPNKAIQLQGYKDRMLMAMSKGLFAE